MLKCFAGLLLCLLFNTHSHAQSHEVGLGGGIANYRGDMSPIINITQPALHGVFFYRYNANEAWSFRLNGALGQIRSTDSKSNDIVAKARGHEFLTGVLEISGQIEYNFLNFGNGKPRKPQPFSPYALLGFGVFKMESIRNSNATYSSWARCMPMGIGLKYLLNKHLQINTEFGARFTSTDYIDDLGLNTNSSASNNTQNTKLYTGNPNTKDMYFFTNLSISYLFLNKRKNCPIKM